MPSPSSSAAVLGALGGAGADDHLLAGPGQPVGQAAALVAGAAQDADDQAGHVRQLPGVALEGGLRAGRGVRGLRSVRSSHDSDPVTPLRRAG